MYHIAKVSIQLIYRDMILSPNHITVHCSRGRMVFKMYVIVFKFIVVQIVSNIPMVKMPSLSQLVDVNPVWVSVC